MNLSLIRYWNTKIDDVCTNSSHLLMISLRTSLRIKIGLGQDQAGDQGRAGRLCMEGDQAPADDHSDHYGSIIMKA